MNKNKLVMAVFAVLVSAAVSARAGEVVDFDGKSAKAVSFTEALESVEAGMAAPLAVQVQDKKQGIKIKAIMKNGEKIKEETLTCQPGMGADKISDCRKGDSSALGYEDLNTLSLRTYFSAETLKFADLLNQTKHSYTNQSGPMTFSCEDECATYTSVGACLGPLCVDVPVTCQEWTHSCTCTLGCDN